LLRVASATREINRAFVHAQEVIIVAQSLYTSGQYLKTNPTWHVEESSWKVSHILPMLKRHHLEPSTICEAGCGAGEVLRLLQENMSEACTFWGYDISPQALEMCKQRANERLHFKLADITQEQEVFFDLILVLDVIEHLEDYFRFLRDLKPKSRYKLFHIPLEISVQGALRGKIFLRNRDIHGHLHPFSKETALRTLEDAGYEVLDYSYSPEYEMYTSLLQTNLMKLPRKLLFALHQDWAVRILGGSRILVLAQ
jgi:cyclopropane fatty-acyl-phospholipid synthase-like methyltransferase